MSARLQHSVDMRNRRHRRSRCSDTSWQQQTSLRILRFINFFSKLLFVWTSEIHTQPISEKCSDVLGNSNYLASSSRPPPSHTCLDHVWNVSMGSYSFDVTHAVEIHFRVFGARVWLDDSAWRVVRWKISKNILISFELSQFELYL